ncbi:unnamed protein product [Fusarium graminearum]|uniref:Chromosome 2, complete genome n=1 Tax=Gibberella zeae (strain ATCC MYA-4620 / CBS 123657 / FGSC 9075 / NRRL 31084 / PH-1) TaxID=229533 RepID=I1S954_GIBZE|nr:hypothetical protein FGSG_13384 [Fusarium graminearum PH-1]ESU15013.1 hypothetical protein FGSG_13384 [Fusarium graminearum PH-1]CEF76663.1 unnamed protein product [Fusarium graminearum]CZS79955.1 unnamed protein product [Fusarium graminearum]|eukprot:XP_011320438.1 hypothetical protein FGSG_13384 [Fusarium graminearum PH-1]
MRTPSAVAGQCRSKYYENSSKSQELLLVEEPVRPVNSVKSDLGTGLARASKRTKSRKLIHSADRQSSNLFNSNVILSISTSQTHKTKLMECLGLTPLKGLATETQSLLIVVEVGVMILCLAA